MAVQQATLVGVAARQLVGALYTPAADPTYAIPSGPMAAARIPYCVLVIAAGRESWINGVVQFEFGAAAGAEFGTCTLNEPDAAGLLNRTCATVPFGARLSTAT